MAKLTKIDRAACRQLGTEIEQAVQAIAKKHGVAISVAGGTFTPSNFTAKVEVSLIVDGQVQTPEALDYEARMPLYGLKDAPLGTLFMHNGRSYAIVGAKPRSRNPILVRRDDGREFKMSIELVKAGLARKEA